MAVITILIVVVLVPTLIINITVKQRKNNDAENVEMQECDLNNDNMETEITKVTLGSNPDEAACQNGSPGCQNPMNVPSMAVDKYEADPVDKLAGEQITSEHHIAVVFEGLASEAEASAANIQVQILKDALKVACLVISVSTTGLVSLLSGLPGSQSSTKRNPLFKAGIFSMCAATFSALVLLILSTHRLNFSGSIITVRITIWVSTALMTIAVILLIIFYLQSKPM